jgi:geranylgeranyl pyrophosphate synthase
MELVRTYLKNAKASLNNFPDSAAKRSLVLMVDFVGDRDW